MMRIITISLIITALSADLSAQGIPVDTLVSINFEGIPLKEALNAISNKYGVRFSYSDSKIPVNDTIDHSFEAVPLGNVLRSILRENGVSYNIISNQIVLLPFNKKQTIIIRGIITDRFSGLPVPYASIALSGTSRGTSSNEDGEFQLSVTKLPTELLVSHINYEKKPVYVYDESGEAKIDLLPTQKTLSEITISSRQGKKSNYHLVKKAFGVLSKSRIDKKYGKAFYRQKSSREDSYTEIFEIFYDIKYSSNGIEDWAVQEGRYAFQKEKEYDIFLYNKNFTLLSRLFPLQQPATDSYTIPIHRDVKKLFDLELLDVLKFGDRMVAVISYTPKPDVIGPAASGALYIDIDSYEILKMKGVLTDDELDIIGFADKESGWKNSKLEFQISFIDNQSGELQMDFVRIDHQFDYFFQNAPVGKIKTNSVLTFYEHYTPAKNKRLGGAINFRVSDVEVIGGVGYNKTFWAQNPIVKRTPLEEKLIRDFEENDAFGVVFMNNEEQIVLLQDKKDSKRAKAIIRKYEAENANKPAQRLFVRMDRENYSRDASLRFAAYILDGWSLKPDLFGSVLSAELYDAGDNLLMQRKFNIKEGMAYGEIDLSEITSNGTINFKAFANSDAENIFTKSISVSNISQSTGDKSYPNFGNANNATCLNFFPEGQTLLNGVSSKMVFKTGFADGHPFEADWNLFDDQGAILKTGRTNALGIGSFDYTPNHEKPVYLKIIGNGFDSVWKVPGGNNAGISLHVSDETSRSLKAELYMKPALPQDIYLLSTSSGKVFSFYEKRLNGAKTVVELPTAHLPGGVNTLVVLTKTGEVVSRRTFFVEPDELDIQLKSAKWISKRKVRLEFEVKDQTGYPVEANLSAVCSSTRPECSNRCDIRNHLYFRDVPGLKQVDLDMKNDSIRTLIHDVLQSTESNEAHAPVICYNREATGFPDFTNMPPIEEPVVAEISVSSNYTRGKSIRKNRWHQADRPRSKNNLYWIPTLVTETRGIAALEYRVDSKARSIYVYIQGVSGAGHLGNKIFEIYPNSIKTKRKSE
ncbi:MAG: carboxypeptidase-like regulatory domain-containing protein [Cytophagales bacterium]|nr:carboxypeptidase-like regulatory domain-containing protein [Cytophagales bacterium]